MKPITEKIAIAALTLGAVALGGYIVLAASAGFNVSLDVSSPVGATVKWAAPEGRIGAPGTNWDTSFFLTVKTADGITTLYSMPVLATTDDRGRYLTPINLAGVNAGTYDVYIKGHQSITKKLDNVALVGGTNRLNFTTTDNSTATGTERLLAGDISGLGTTPSNLGDDVINAVDLDIMLTSLDADDVGGNGIRANANQDDVINSIDLSLLLNNLDKEGDK